MRIVSLIDTLIEEYQTTMNCVKDNNMIVNPKKFQTVLVLKTKNTIPEDLNICINDVNMKLQNSVKILRITLNNNAFHVKLCRALLSLDFIKLYFRFYRDKSYINF